MYYPPPVKTLLPSLKLGKDDVTCSLKDFRKLLKLVLQSVEVDEEWYLSVNPDVKAAIEKGDVASATQHYQEAGYMEGRFPFNIEVDETWYVQRNPDVAGAISQKKIESAANHFWTTGYLEGRLPRKVPVDERWYLGQYPHARQRVERKVSRDAVDDYARFGYMEGLRPFNPAVAQTRAKEPKPR